MKRGGGVEGAHEELNCSRKLVFKFTLSEDTECFCAIYTSPVCRSLHQTRYHQLAAAHLLSSFYKLLLSAILVKAKKKQNKNSVKGLIVTL